MKPLEGIKVVEFSTHVVVPIAARVMADWGADVIKIESADGDPWRNQGNYDKLPTSGDCNPLFSVNNCGKRFVSLNLKTPEGKEALLKLLAEADVFMTNIRWAGINRLGLDYDSLHKRFPRLIYCHFTGFGYEGPDKDKPGFDFTAFWCATGAAHEIHNADVRPSGFPAGFGDTAVSNSVLSGITAALYHRERTGEGLRLSTSLFANGLWCNFVRFVAEQERKDGTPASVYPIRSEDYPNPFSNVYQCKDGEWILLAAVYNKYSPALFRVTGLDRFLEDERFRVLPLAPEDGRALYHALCAVFLTKTSAEWAAVLDPLDFPYQILQHTGDLARSEQAWANRYITNTSFPNGMEFVLPNSPVTFFGIDLPDTTHAGDVGCDTSRVLAEYGYSPEAIQSLFDRGIAAGK